MGVGRSFLAGEGLDQGVQFEVFFNDLITVDVLVELLVSEVIGGFKLEDGWVSEEYGDLIGGVEDGHDDGLDLALEMEFEVLFGFAGALHGQQNL